MRDSFDDKTIHWKELHERSRELAARNESLQKTIPDLKSEVNELKAVLNYVEKVKMKDVLRDAIAREKERPPVESIPIREPERKITINKVHSHDMER